MHDAYLHALFVTGEGLGATCPHHLLVTPCFLTLHLFCTVLHTASPPRCCASSNFQRMSPPYMSLTPRESSLLNKKEKKMTNMDPLCNGPPYVKATVLPVHPERLDAIRHKRWRRQKRKKNEIKRTYILWIRPAVSGAFFDLAFFCLVFFSLLLSRGHMVGQQDAHFVKLYTYTHTIFAGVSEAPFWPCFREKMRVSTHPMFFFRVACR